MANDLKVYNHLKYQDQSDAQDDGFVKFLLQESEPLAPEIDEQKAWATLNKKINQPISSFNWMKVAAAVAILATLSISLFLYNPTINQVSVFSTEKKINVTFPDGSTGILNKNSSFEYPEKFGDERNVSLTGEAYFDIKKSHKPFIIDVNGVDVKVLGTAFNLVTTNDEVRLYVDRGLVAFEKAGKQTKVSKGNEAIFNRKDASIKIMPTPSANIMSWRNGVFNFNETPLNDALNALSKYYEVKFELANNQLQACKISATFNQQSLNEVLRTIGTVLDVKTSQKNDIVKISGKGC